MNSEKTVQAPHSAKTLIALVDCNNFYASCERVFEPALYGKPIGVLSNNDGCIIARSNELKALNIEMGAPAFQVYPHVKRLGITLRSSNYALYGDMSARVIQVLTELSPSVERYSIDEAFVDLTGMNDQSVGFCRQLADTVPRHTGIPVSVGAAPSKTLAKIANHLAKKQAGRNNVCVFDNPDDAELLQWLKTLPVEEIWGVGKRLGQKLRLKGIETAMDLREANPQQLKKNFSVLVARTQMELQGTPCIQLDDAPEPKQSIMCSRSFSTSTNSLNDLKAAIRFHCQSACEKLRRQNSLAQAVLVTIRSRSERFKGRAYDASAIALPQASDDTQQILHTAQQQLEAIYQPGVRYHKAGIMLLDLIPWRPMQLGLLESEQAALKEEGAKTQKLMQTLDQLNHKMGRHTVAFGLPVEDARWQMKMAHRSPRYTTCWSEIPRVKAC